MRLISWNVNGLRAVIRKGVWNQIFDTNPDIICIQETKASPEQLEGEVCPPGYFAYYASSTARKGYSGVGLFSRIEPKKVTEGFEIERFDEYGRVLTAFFDSFVVITAYFPNGASKTAPLDYKLDFYDEFLSHCNKLRNEGYSIIFGGDLNVAHEAIDLARPEANKTSIGFLPEERAWIDELIRHGYMDTFRHFNPQKTGVYTYWDLKSGARERNVGWRLDYWFVSLDLLPQVKKAEVLSDIYGSDHCPILLEIAL